MPKSTLIIFGATGDLMARKIAPSLFHLYGEGQIDSDFSVIGFGRREFSDSDFRKFLLEGFYKHSHTSNSLLAMTPRMEKFLDLFSYHQGQFDNLSDFEKLNKKLAGMQSNKLFYLAVPPEHYDTIFRNISKSGLAEESEDAWSRIIVEKPFGNNLQHAEKLDALLNSLFQEKQIYRIDHYLAKELLQNIATFRFANNLLEEVWNKDFIESIDIRLLEKIDIEGRGKFYDAVGALLDVGQNHLLQMLALVAMDRPEHLNGDSLRQKRADVLEKVKILSPAEVATKTIQGQYEGYTKEKDVAADSKTETYFKIQAEIDSERWRGVPITMEAGKKFPKVSKEIVVTFRGGAKKNRIIFRLQPDPGITIEFWSKKPGHKDELECQQLSFGYGSSVSESRYIVEYATLFADAIVGDQTLFVSGRETMAGWKFIDPIVAGWRENLAPLKIYKAGEILREKLGGAKKGKKVFGILGLGRMGGGLALRMIDQGWTVHGWNRTFETTEKFAQQGLLAAESIADLVKKLPKPRIVWLMLPAGTDVEIEKYLSKGDLVIDGGNSFYKDSIKMHAKLKKLGIDFIDVGVSGGPWGARNRPCLMVGGEKEVYERVRNLFQDMAVNGSVQFFEGPGAGHFVKMVHNGIEYGMMQAIGEGFDILRHSEYNLDLHRVTDIYNKGSVVESRLVGWLADAYKKYGLDLETISGKVSHTGEGEWTIKTAEEMKLKSAVLKAAFDFRIQSQEHPSYAGKVVSALRGEFGQHQVKEE